MEKETTIVSECSPDVKDSYIDTIKEVMKCKTLKNKPDQGITVLHAQIARLEGFSDNIEMVRNSTPLDPDLLASLKLKVFSHSYAAGYRAFRETGKRLTNIPPLVTHNTDLI